MTEAEETRQRIIRTAQELFGKYGYSMANTNLIAAELGISKRTLYENFPSKEQLLLECVHDIMEKAKALLNDILDKIKDPEENYIEQILRTNTVKSEFSPMFTTTFFKDIRKSAPKIWDMISKFRQEQMLKYFGKMNEIGVKRGYVKKHINQEILYIMYFTSIDTIISPDVISRLPVTAEEASRQIFEIILTGSLSDKGKEELQNII